MILELFFKSGVETQPPKPPISLPDSLSWAFPWVPGPCSYWSRFSWGKICVPRELCFMVSPEVMQVEAAHTYQGAQDLGCGIGGMPSNNSRYADNLREMQKLLGRFMQDEDRIQSRLLILHDALRCWGRRGAEIGIVQRAYAPSCLLLIIISFP